MWSFLAYSTVVRFAIEFRDGVTGGHMWRAYFSLLTHLFPMYPFSTLWKHQKIFFFCFTEFLLNRAFFFRYESSQHRYWSSSHKSYSWNFRKIQRETPKPQCNFIRKRLWNRYSHVKSLKFWGGTMFLAEHLRVTAFVVSFELLHFQFLSCSRKLVLSM